MKQVYLLLASAFLLFFCCGCNRTHSVIFWPQNAVQGTSSAPEFDSHEQIEALKTAKPDTDAQRAFASGDLRFVGDRFVMARFHGISYDHIVREWVEKYGYKVVAYSEVSLKEDEFFRLKSNYETEYNKMLYSLIADAVNR